MNKLIKTDFEEVASKLATRFSKKELKEMFKDKIEKLENGIFRYQNPKGPCYETYSQEGHDYWKSAPNLLFLLKLLTMKQQILILGVLLIIQVNTNKYF